LSLDMSDSSGDFGTGFYLSDSIVVAYQAALRHADPCLLVFLFSRGWQQISHLMCKTFSSTWNDVQNHWRNFVWSNRKNINGTKNEMMLREVVASLPYLCPGAGVGNRSSVGISADIDIIAGPVCTNPPILNQCGVPVMLPGGCRRSLQARHLAFARYADASRLVLTDRNDIRKAAQDDLPLGSGVEEVWDTRRFTSPSGTSMESPPANPAEVTDIPLQFCFRTNKSLRVLSSGDCNGLNPSVSVEVWLFPPSEMVQAVNKQNEETTLRKYFHALGTSSEESKIWGYNVPGN